MQHAAPARNRACRDGDRGTAGEPMCGRFDVRSRELKRHALETSTRTNSVRGTWFDNPFMPFMRALLVSTANRVDHPTTSRARTRAHNDDRRVPLASAERHICARVARHTERRFGRDQHRRSPCRYVRPWVLGAGLKQGARWYRASRARRVIAKMSASLPHRLSNAKCCVDLACGGEGESWRWRSARSLRPSCLMVRAEHVDRPRVSLRLSF